MQKIKCELNPYGLDLLRKESTGKKHKIFHNLSIENQYLSDSHIWQAIAAYEANLEDHTYLEVLLLQLNYLLKFDWERSKQEAYGFNRKLALAVFSIIFASICSGFPQLQHQGFSSKASGEIFIQNFFLYGTVILMLYTLSALISHKWIALIFTILFFLLYIILLGLNYLQYFFTYNPFYLFSAIFLIIGFAAIMDALRYTPTQRNKDYISASSKASDALRILRSKKIAQTETPTEKIANVTSSS